ncbi:M48 family metallopeptidase [Patescibacteria group bacterium]|nr:M48 family metallopeptidase [Patescibacteria group bacterium]
MTKQIYPEQLRGIKLQNKKVDYTLKISKRAKGMCLAVYCDGSFVVTKPIGLSENIVEKFIIQKSNWILSKLEYFKQFGVDVFKNDYQKYLAHKDEALDLVKERIKHFNKTYNLKFNKINIKNQKTRWGSCSKKGNLNFNYKILFLPKHITDYIIVHELCHLKEFNHSGKFWDLVNKAIPNHSELKKEINFPRAYARGISRVQASLVQRLLVPVVQCTL